MDVEDEEEVEEEDGDGGFDELVGGKGGEDLLKDFKGVLRTNLGPVKEYLLLFHRKDWNI